MFSCYVFTEFTAKQGYGEIHSTQIN